MGGMGGTPERSDAAAVGSWLRRHWFALVAWSGLVVAVAFEVANHGLDLSEWGWFWLSGIVAFLVAVQISRHQGDRVDRTSVGSSPAASSRVRTAMMP